MNRPTQLAFGTLFGLAVILLGSGCGSGNKYSAGEPTLNVRQTHNQVAVGETVTFFGREENTLGRNAQLRWESTGGEVTTEDNGRVARVKFDKPGTYKVDGVLLIDGKEVQRGSNEVRVAAIE